MKRSPKLENGYIRYPHELDAALACADFTKGARIVLREVFAQIYGPAETATAKVSPSVLAGLYGSDRGTFGRSIKELMDSGALEKLGECEYRFVADYSRWTKNGRRRLSEIEMDLALNATARAMSHQQSCVGNSAYSHQPKSQANTLRTVASNGAIQPTEPLAESPTTLAIQPTAARQSSLRDVGNLAYAGGESPHKERVRERHAAENVETCLPAGQPDFSSSIDPNLSEADRIGQQVEEWFPGAGWGVEAFELCKTHSSASVEWGFRTAYKKNCKGERVFLKRIIGLVNYAEENPMAPEVRGPDIQRGTAAATAAASPARSAPALTENQMAEQTRRLKEKRERREADERQRKLDQQRRGCG